MTKVIPLVLLATFLNASGQIFFKKTSNSLPPPSLNSFSASYDFLRKVVAVPWVWLGLGLMGIGLASWLLAIAQADLSFVYLVGSLYYVLVFVMSRIFLGEKINSTKFLGTLLVGIGIILIARS